MALCFAVNAQAEMYWFVPMTELDDAVSSATSGDTIIITDSGTLDPGYRLDLDKQLYIMAADGEQPILEEEVRFSAGSIGSMFGSNVGGTIQLGESTSIDPGANWIDINWPGDGEVICENLLVLGREELLYETSGGGACTSLTVITLNDIDFLGTGGAFGSYWRTDSTLNLNRCKFDLQSQACLMTGGSWHHMWFNLANCELRTTNTNRGAFEDLQPNHYVFNATDCLFYACKGIKLHEGGASMTLKRCVLIGDGFTDRYTTITSNYYGLIGTEPPGALHINAYQHTDSRPDPRNRGYWDGEWSQPTRVYAERCDLISSGSAVMMQDYMSTDRQITIVDSNLIAKNADPVVTCTLNAFDSLTLTNCNLYTYGTGALLAGSGVSDPDFTNTGQQNLDPSYHSLSTQFADLDLTYDNATLLTAGTGGGPIGVNQEAWQMVPVELSTFSIQ
jgi:hypothetical protein